MNRLLAPVIKSVTFDKNHQMANFFLSTDNVMSAMSPSDLSDSVLAQTLTTNNENQMPGSGWLDFHSIKEK